MWCLMLGQFHLTLGLHHQSSCEWLSCDRGNEPAESRRSLQLVVTTTLSPLLQHATTRTGLVRHGGALVSHAEVIAILACAILTPVGAWTVVARCYLNPPSQWVSCCQRAAVSRKRESIESTTTQAAELLTSSVASIRQLAPLAASLWLAPTVGLVEMDSSAAGRFRGPQSQFGESEDAS